MSGLRHLGINAVFLEPPMGGLETYARALVPALLRARPGLRISVYCNPAGRDALASEPWAGEARLVVHPLLGRPGLRAASELALLGPIADRRRVDVLHSLALTGPLRMRAAHVDTIADVTWMHTADPAERATMRLWRAIVPAVARRAQRLLAISHSAADLVVERLRVPREVVDVVYLGHGVERHPDPVPARVLRERLALGDGPVVFTASAKREHKNLLRLVQAMPEVRRRVPDATLVLPGRPTPHEQRLREEARRLGISDAVRFPDHVEPDELEGLYGLAACFAFPSLYEGFGLPLLEAMARDVPVACSNVSALPEVAGDAARLFDPLDVGAIASAIVDVLTNEALRARLVAAGRRRASAFSWEACAEGTLESYERALRPTSSAAARA